ncbi:MAG: hypothetical protein LWX07_04030 [Bacteroidetes bacterium]|nr:hypothetical protein [Bacteroidota bacterium]
MRKIFFIILIFSTLKQGFAGNEPQELPKTNFVLFSELLGKGLNMIEDEITVLGKEKIYKLDAGQESEMKNFFLNVFRQKFATDRVVYEKKTDTSDFEIHIKNLDMKTSYSRPEGKSLLGDDFTDRTISASFEYGIYRGGTELSSKKFFENYKDNINVKDYEYVQNQEFTFMNSELPGKSFLGKIFVPAVVVLSSAAAVILFFTIRSK